MNDNRKWVVIIAAFIFVAIAGVVGYNIGLEQGALQSGKVTVAPPPAAGAQPYAYPYPYYHWHRPWSPFGAVMAAIFFVFLLSLMARAFGHGRCWRGYHPHHHEAGGEQPR
jgi:hypothetical protein